MQIKIFFTASTGITEELQLLLDQLSEASMEYSLFNVDEPEAAASAEVLDILDTPAVVVTRADGAPVHTWQHSLPQVSQISAALGRV